MGFSFCRSKPSSVAASKAVQLTAVREETARVTNSPEASSGGAASEVPALTEALERAAPRTRLDVPLPPLAQWSNARRDSLPRSRPTSGGPSPLFLARPSPHRSPDHAGRATGTTGSTASAAQVPASILSSGSRHTSDPSSRTRLYESTVDAPSNIRRGRPASLSAMDVDTISGTGGGRAASPVQASEGGAMSGILRPGSAYADTPTSALHLRPGSTDRQNSSQSSGPPSTVMPRRGSVRFLGSDDIPDDPDDVVTAAREASVYQWSRRGSLDIGLLPPLPKPPSLATAAAEAITSPNLLPGTSRSSGSGRQNVSTSDPSSVQGDCSLALTGPALTARESPSPWPANEELTMRRLSPRPRNDKRCSNAGGGMGGLAPFGSSDTSERSGIFSAEAGSSILGPLAVLAPAASGASQSPKSILLRPSSISSPAGMPFLTSPGINANRSENASPGGHRGSRRRTSESPAVGMEQRPSFTASVTRRASDNRHRRHSAMSTGAGGGDNSSDDEQIVQSVRSTMQRLQHSETSGSGRSSNSVRSSNSNSNGNGTGSAEARALSAAARVSNTLLPMPKLVQPPVYPAIRRPTSSTANSSTTSTTHYNEYSLPVPSSP